MWELEMIDECLQGFSVGNSYGSLTAKDYGVSP